MKVGIYWLGIMGKPMSKNLLAGYSLVVSDRNPEAIADVIAGAGNGSTAKAIAEQCDLRHHHVLPNSPHVKEEVALGGNGIIERREAGNRID